MEEIEKSKLENKNRGDLLMIILFLSLISLFMSSIAFYLGYNRIQGQEAGIWEGYMSIVPPDYITLNFTPLDPKIGNKVILYPLICNRFSGCISCTNCTLDIYKEIDGSKQLEQRTNYTNESFSMAFNYNPMWVYMVFPNVSEVWVRIPKPNFWQTINIMMKGYSFKIDGYIFLWTIISIVAFIITSIIKIFLWVYNKINKKKLTMIQLLKMIARYLYRLFSKYWFGIIIGILLLIFIFEKNHKLISGGVILILMGVKQYLLRGLREKEPNYLLFGIPAIYMGIISLITYFLISKNIDLLVFLIIFIFICMIILYNFLKNYLKKGLNFIVLIILVYFLMAITISINSLLNSIDSNGFTNMYLYLGIIAFMALTVLAYFTLYRILFDFIKRLYNCSLFNNYFYLSLAIMTIILFSGYFYIQNLSQDRLKDFLIIISLAFVTSFAGASYIKHLAK